MVISILKIQFLRSKKKKKNPIPRVANFMSRNYYINSLILWFHFDMSNKAFASWR